MLNTLLKPLKAFLGILIPVLAKGKAHTSSRAFRLGLHFAVVALIVLALWALNHWLQLGNFLASGTPPFVQQNWLPLLFLLLYALGWTIWWFWTLLRAAPEASPFPDIDSAWHEAKLALAGGELALGDLPLFLILGEPEEGEEALFESLALTLPQSPRSSSAPLHLYASKEAIYVTCGGASLLGTQARVLSERLTLSTPPELQSSASGGDKTLQIGQGDPETAGVRSVDQRIKAIEANARAEGRGPAQLNKIERLEVKRLKRQLARVGGTRHLHDQIDIVERQLARLRHLCNLIARDRRPFCGINGILTVIPIAAADDDLDATETGRCLNEDLAAVRETIQVECPVFTLISGLEQLPGFDAFIAHLPSAQLRGRVGQRLPLVMELDPSKIPAVLADAVNWLGLKMFPSLALPAWKLDTPGVTDLTESVRANSELYGFLSEIRDRQARISDILKRGIVNEQFGGCYVAATGHGSEREQAFLRGVFGRLSEEQDFVAWTPEALAEDESYRRLTRIGYVILGLVLLVEAGVLTGRLMRYF